MHLPQNVIEEFIFKTYNTVIIVRMMSYRKINLEKNKTESNQFIAASKNRGDTLHATVRISIAP